MTLLLLIQWNGFFFQFAQKATLPMNIITLFRSDKTRNSINIQCIYQGVNSPTTFHYLLLRYLNITLLQFSTWLAMRTLGSNNNEIYMFVDCIKKVKWP